MLDNAERIYRILGPAKDAFDYREELLKAVISLIEKNTNVLVLLALGSTATVLAAELSKRGIQAIDIGHLDICYEWLKQGNFDAVPGKYTNEAEGGDIVGECYDKEYLSEIVWKYSDNF